jgi:hypothetical protein
MIDAQTNIFTPQWRVFGSNSDIQKPFDVAVIMPTIVGPEVLKAIQSVYEQRGVNRIQLLVGIDKPIGEVAGLIELLSNSPEHITSCLFYPGYSTSVRHGGLHPAKDGGVLRCTLTHLANAEYVSYLDDDNWWGNTHLLELLSAINGHEWAYSLRWFVHPVTKHKICIDDWESVGIGKGIFLQDFGGFVDPNCLMFNKLTCWQCVALWNIPLIGDVKAMSADRNVFNFLSNHSNPGETKNPTAYYVIDPNDVLHKLRLHIMGDKYTEPGTQGNS